MNHLILLRSYVNASRRAVPRVAEISCSPRPYRPTTGDIKATKTGMTLIIDIIISLHMFHVRVCVRMTKISVCVLKSRRADVTGH
jgi:hypothetical protein